MDFSAIHRWCPSLAIVTGAMALVGLRGRLITLFLCAAIAQECAAQCETWQGLGRGLNGEVWELAEYNGELIAGGLFSSAAGLPVNRIARLDSKTGTWQPLGSGTSGLVSVMTVYNNQLIAGGFFTVAGGQAVFRIAAWDGSAWHGLGGGMSDYVTALAVYNGDLIAGGGFTIAGGVNANHVARWNGTSWQPMGNAFNDPNESVGDLFVWNNELYGVSISRFARWNSVDWQTLPGPGFSISCMEGYICRLIAAGFNNGATSARIAGWDGTFWHPLASGLQGSFPHGRTLTVYNGDLISGGSFSLAGGQPANGIARWNGVFWQPLQSVADGAESPQFLALTVYNNDLIAGGSFISVDGRPLENIARWRDCNLCLADVAPPGGDHQVNIDDLVSVITSWGPCPPQPPWCGEDVIPIVVGDGQVNLDDLARVIACFNVCPDGDTNDDGYTNIDDLVNVITHLGPCPAKPPPLVCEADITRSGVVNIDDLVAVITAWGPCP